MKPVIGVMLAGLLLCGTAQGADADQKGKKHSKYQRVEDRSRVDIHVVFSPREVRVLREYYTPRYRHLPPGLQKKLRRTGQLPSGWQKKMEPFPVVVERDLVALPPGYGRGVIDGHAVIYNTRTQTIIDVAVLF